MRSKTRLVNGGKAVEATEGVVRELCYVHTSGYLYGGFFGPDGLPGGVRVVTLRDGGQGLGCVGVYSSSRNW